MKKLVCLMLMFSFVLALGNSAAASGNSDLTEPNSQNVIVEAKYQDESTTASAYSVEISWGNMQFTYTVSGARVWDPETHTYASPEGGWSADGGTITVTNHSNVAVNASFSFAPFDNFSTVTGTFDIYSRQLAAGAEGDPDSADSVTATLTLGGTLSSSVTSFTRIGYATVTIA